MNESNVYENLYSYDVRSCYYTMFNSVGFDVGGEVNIFNKKERNVRVGKLQKGNSNLSNNLISTVDYVINDYISSNLLNLDDILIRQRDGFICKRKIYSTNSSIPIGFKGKINKLIFGVNKNKFILIHQNGTVSVKGISRPYDSSFFNLFKCLDFSNYKNLILGLEKMRNQFFTKKNMLWHCYKIDNSYTVKLKNGTYIQIPDNKLSYNYINVKYIDKQSEWMVIWPFIQNIIKHWS